MCGIVAAARLQTKAKKVTAEVQEEVMRFWHTELMMLTEERGKDAAGSVLLWEDGGLLGIKHGVAVSKLICDWKPEDKKKNYQKFMRVWRKYNDSPISTVIGHCRKLSVGTAWKNENNHPHYVGKKIVLVHNGTLKNHKKIEKHYDFQTVGDTDSEIIAHLVHRANHTKPKKEDKGIFNFDQAKYVVERLDGSFAVLTMNVDNPYQILAFRDGRPIEAAFSSKAGLLFLASDDKYFGVVLARYERMRRYYGFDHWPDLDLTKRMMPDDSAWIINLKHIVDNDTKLSNLVTKKAMPKTVNRLDDFKDDTKTTGYSGYGGYHNRNNVNHSVNQTPAGNASGDKTETNTGTETETRLINGKERKISPTHKSGFIWHPTEKVYVKQDFTEGIPEDNKDKETIEKTSAMDADVEDLSKSLTNEEKEKLENKDKPKTKLRKAADKDKDKKGEEPEVQSVPASEIVDEDKHKEVDEAAETYRKTKCYFKTDSDAKDSANIQTVDEVEFRLIANRIAGKVGEAAFKEGWKGCEENAGVTCGSIRRTIDSLTAQVSKENKAKQTAEDKQKRAQQNLLTLKSLSVFMLALLDYIGDMYEVEDEAIIHALQIAASLNHMLDFEDVANVFTERELAMLNMDRLVKAVNNSASTSDEEEEAVVAAEEGSED